MRQCYSAVLPRWVYRVPSCPNPRNYSQWIEASKRLNCYHRLDSTDVTEQAMVYHCLPSTFLNETVEFCGTNVPVSPGNTNSLSLSLLRRKKYINQPMKFKYMS